ncbi:MAG: hypothetical protein WBG71_04520 [Leeuwenhoekiella sp.]
MKYLIYFFVGMLALTACEPLDEIYDELEANEGDISGVTQYTVTEDNYDEVLSTSGDFFFNTLEDAEGLIPSILNERFPVLGEGSSVDVTYNLFAPVIPVDYSVQTEEYAEIGLSDDYFTSLGDIQDFLDFQYPQANLGDHVSLTYRTLADEIMYMFTDEDFDLIGEELASKYPTLAGSAANFGNFDRREGRDTFWTDSQILEAINVVLSERFEDVTNQKYNVSYDVFTGSAEVEDMTVQYNGNAYIAVGGTPYELNRDDYNLEDELGEAYPAATANAARFGSFDIRNSGGTAWSQAMLLEAFNIILKRKFPTATDGTQFELTYAGFNGSGVSSLTTAVILDGTEYVIDNSSTLSVIEVTNLFALGSDSWRTPYELTLDDYDAMGQRFPNFSDEMEAGYKIAILLGMQRPFAQPGDFTSVTYDFFVSGEGVSTRYSNFFFQDDKWNFVPRVIETSTQFSFTDGEWVPDNTIFYKLAASDYEYIVNELADKYPNQTDSMDRFGNFDRRSGNSAFWDDDMIVEALGLLLDNVLAPSAEEAQKYAITFDIFNGSNTTETFELIKEDGVWKQQ